MSSEARHIYTPLYQTLKSKLSGKKLKVAEKKQLIEYLENADDSVREIAYLLILEHNSLTTNPNMRLINPESIQIPYEGKQIESNVIEFDLNNMPPDLLEILNQFIQFI